MQQQNNNSVTGVQSFSIDHMRLQPGIYVSRVEGTSGGEDVLVTYDIRLRRPNFEDALTPEVSHTIEHLGAIFLRRHPEHGSHIVYFGPMGCLTGMYMIYRWTSEQHPSMRTIVSLVMSMMKFIVVYNGNLSSVGFDPEQCGNYSLADLDGAKNIAANFLTLDDAFGTLRFEYPDDQNSAGVETSTQVYGNDKINNMLDKCRRVRHDINIDYSQLQIDVNSDIVSDPHSGIVFSKKTQEAEEELSLDDVIQQINPLDIALFLKKKHEFPQEETVLKAFPIEEDVKKEKSSKVQTQQQKKTVKPILIKKKKKKVIQNVGDALF